MTLGNGPVNYKFVDGDETFMLFAGSLPVGPTLYGDAQPIPFRVVVRAMAEMEIDPDQAYICLMPSAASLLHDEEPIAAFHHEIRRASTRIGLSPEVLEAAFADMTHPQGVGNMYEAIAEAAFSRIAHFEADPSVAPRDLPLEPLLLKLICRRLAFACSAAFVALFQQEYTYPWTCAQAVNVLRIAML